MVRDIVNIARSGGDDVKMQAIHALATLADGDVSTQNAVREADGLSVLIPMLSSDYPEHLEVACTALGKLCRGCRQNANEVNQQGGLSFLMDLLSSPSSDVREQACMALQPLVNDNDGAPHTHTHTHARARARTHLLSSQSFPHANITSLCIPQTHKEEF